MVRAHSAGVNPRCASEAVTTSASAGKIGFCSSGRTRPTSRPRSPRNLVGRSYPRTSSAVSTDARVDSETPLRPLSTRLTVASLTPAFLATSARRLVTAESYVKNLQNLNLDLQHTPDRRPSLQNVLVPGRAVFHRCCAAYPVHR